MVCNRSRASSTRTRPTSRHIGWRVNENFPETLKSQLEKNKSVIHRPRCALGLSKFFPIRTSHPVNIYISRAFFYFLFFFIHLQHTRMAVDICLLEFFNAFKAKNNEKFQKAKMQIIPPTKPRIHRASQSFHPFGQRLSIPAADQKDRSSGNENAQPPSLRYTLITLLNVPTLSI